MQHDSQSTSASITYALISMVIGACSLSEPVSLSSEETSQAQQSCSNGAHSFSAPSDAQSNQNVRFDARVSLCKSDHSGITDPRSIQARVMASAEAEGFPEVLVGRAVLSTQEFEGFVGCWENPETQHCYFTFFGAEPLRGGPNVGDEVSWQLRLELDVGTGTGFEYLGERHVNVQTAATSFSLAAPIVICQDIPNRHGEPPFECVTEDLWGKISSSTDSTGDVPRTEYTLPPGDGDYFALLRLRVTGVPTVSASAMGRSAVQGEYRERFYQLPGGPETYLEVWFHARELYPGVAFTTTFFASGAGAEPASWDAPVVRTRPITCPSQCYLYTTPNVGPKGSAALPTQSFAVEPTRYYNGCATDVSVFSEGNLIEIGALHWGLPNAERGPNRICYRCDGELGSNAGWTQTAGSCDPAG